MGRLAGSRGLMPDNVAAALAVLITAMATALLQYSTSHWGKSVGRKDDEDDARDARELDRRRDRRRGDHPYDGPERRHRKWDPDFEEE